jgi:hypothetical protein
MKDDDFIWITFEEMDMPELPMKKKFRDFPIQRFLFSPKPRKSTDYDNSNHRGEQRS